MDPALTVLTTHMRATEIYLYAITRHDTSQYRQVLQREIPNFRSLPNTKTDKACAQVIADDAIHVLINLNSHTAGERNGIFAFRPAPVQVCMMLPLPLQPQGASCCAVP